jgi:2-amino-4-hydroxy-6-hydroxymethyldihydropteridine diphosphokinase
VSGTDGGTHRAFIALGSNIEPARHLPLAVERLSALGTIAAVSSVYESPPVDGSAQPDYLNAAVLLATTLSPDQLCHEALPAIEDDLGRLRDPQDRYAPRTIDLDLALYDEQVLTIGHRRIPDPEIPERDFLAVPLAELCGDYRVPALDRTLEELAAPHRSAGSLTPRPDVVLRTKVKPAAEGPASRPC